MSDAPLPIRLEELFFPVQEVRANPSHNPNGNRRGTAISHSVSSQLIDEKENVFGVELELSTDVERSDNPPYFFELHAYGLVAIDPQLDPASARSLAHTNGQLMLVGAARERLLDLTSRAPWGRFVLSAVPVAPLPEQPDSCSESDTQ